LIKHYRTSNTSIHRPNLEEYLLEERKKKERIRDDLLKQIKDRSLASLAEKERDRNKDKEMNEAIQRQQELYIEQQNKNKQAIRDDIINQRNKAIKLKEQKKVLYFISL